MRITDRKSTIDWNAIELLAWAHPWINKNVFTLYLPELIYQGDVRSASDNLVPCKRSNF